MIYKLHNLIIFLLHTLFIFPLQIFRWHSSILDSSKYVLSNLKWMNAIKACPLRHTFFLYTWKYLLLSFRYLNAFIEYIFSIKGFLTVWLKPFIRELIHFFVVLAFRSACIMVRTCILLHVNKLSSFEVYGVDEFFQSIKWKH